MANYGRRMKQRQTMIPDLLQLHNMAYSSGDTGERVPNKVQEPCTITVEQQDVNLEYVVMVTWWDSWGLSTVGAYYGGQYR